jgi:hypothetical protein
LDRLSKAKLRAILQIFTNLQVALEEPSSVVKKDDGSNGDGTDSADSSTYDTTMLVNEILNENSVSPKLFVINLPEADVAPRVVFVFVIIY